MTKDKFISFPVYNLDADSIKHALDELETAINGGDHKTILESTAIALHKIKESLITVLDFRVYALRMQGKFTETIKSAQNMVTYEPNLATGYLRLGDLYRMQGKQLKAIDAYNLGLQNASAEHPDYIQMVKGREFAIKKNEGRVDFVARLPAEIVDDIITLLPSRSKLVHLTVSNVWRNKIFRCSNVWKGITSEDVPTSVIPHIAAHVEDLTITTTDRRVFLRYLLGLTSGSFTKLKLLKLDERATRHINASMIVPVSGAFWTIRSTLTNLVLHFNIDSALITLVDVLIACSSLKSLDYSTFYHLSYAIGELVLLNPHNNLVDMCLEADSITGSDIHKLLSHCPKMRRLILHGCDTTVLDVVDTVCPNLETFGYNPDMNEVQRLDYLDINCLSSGLCRLYTNNGSPSVPVEAILPLIQRNMHSLQLLYGSISDQGSATNLTTLFAGLELRNLNKLVFWGGSSELLQQLILRSISTCTALTQVEAVAYWNIEGLVNALMALPQLEHLNITYSNTEVGELDLVRLFKQYASNSRSKRRLKTIWLRSCPTIVTDDVIDALADIETLEQIWFRELPDVSIYGIDNLFKKRCSSMVDIRLTGMDVITDSILTTIGNLKSLRRICLKELTNISSNGVVDLVERAHNLESLSLVNCYNVTEDVIAHVREKVKNIVFT